MTFSIHLEGINIRSATGGDFASVLKLMVQQQTADFGEALISPERLQARWQSHNLAKDSWLAVGDDSRVLGYAELQYQTPTKFCPLIYLAACEQAEKVGAELLRNAEARIATLSTDTATPYIMSQVSERNAILKRLYEAAGFTTNLSFLLMEIMMADPTPAPRWPDGITVRTFEIGVDEHATYKADEEASQDKGYYQPKTFDQWADRMGLTREDFDPTLWFLACQEGEIVGVCLNRLPEPNVGLIDHLGVRRPWRNQGIGMALLLHSFNTFYRRGIQRVTLSVDSHSKTNAHQLYERAGMRTYQQYHIYTKGDE